MYIWVLGGLRDPIYIIYILHTLIAARANSMPFVNDPLGVNARTHNTENIYPETGSQVQSVQTTMKRKTLTTIPIDQNMPVKKKKKKFRPAFELCLTL